MSVERRTPGGSRRTTLAPQIPRTNPPLSMLEDDPNKWVPEVYDLGAGLDRTFHVDFEVESWIVSIIPTAAVRVSVTTGPSAAGPIVRLAGGATIRIPGDGPDLSLRNTGAVTAAVTVIATVGYRWVQYNGGGVA